MSFRNYTAEGIAIASACHARGVPVLAITDGPLSPLKRVARVCLEIGDDGRKPFRSLVEPMCLAQALVVSVGHLRSPPARQAAATNALTSTTLKRALGVRRPPDTKGPRHARRPEGGQR